MSIVAFPQPSTNSCTPPEPAESGRVSAVRPTEEQQHHNRKTRANSWRPLPLAVAEHAPANMNSPDAHSWHWTPFDAPLPDKVPEKYWINTEEGFKYAVYSLVHIGKDDMTELLHAVKFHADASVPSWRHKVVRAPIYDFCSNQKSLRDVYDYHTSLSANEDHAIASGAFVVVSHADWETEGVLLVHLDCHPVAGGTVGIIRVGVDQLSHHLLLLETSNRNWTDLKAIELETKWPTPISGYTESKWQNKGYSHCDDSRLTGECSHHDK